MKEDLFFLGVKALVTRPDGMILVVRLKAPSGEAGLIFGIYTHQLDSDIDVTLGDEHEEYDWVPT